MTDLRIYNPDDLGPDGYPDAWHHDHWHDDMRYPPIKDTIRELTGHRCERCGHPYRAGNPENSARSQWSPCDDLCTHDGPARFRAAAEDGEWRPAPSGRPGDMYDFGPSGERIKRWEVQAQWRILTVHHLNGIKYDCRWWNLAALCQRCHLSVQGRVVMERVWVWAHTEWFKPHAAAWYAWDYLGEELTREETMERLDELLELERVSEIGPC